MSADPDRLNDAVELARWEISELRPGQSCIYYRGNLGRDRMRLIVRRLAHEVSRRARGGQLLLTQRRIGPPVETTTKAGNPITVPGTFAYIATRTRHA